MVVVKDIYGECDSDGGHGHSDVYGYGCMVMGDVYDGHSDGYGDIYCDGYGWGDGADGHV